MSTEPSSLVQAPSGGEAPSLREHFVFFLVYLVLSVVLLSPMSWSPASRLPDDGDSLQGLWILWWGANHLFSDQEELFQANSYYPHPLGLAYSEPLLAEALLDWPLLKATSNRVLAVNLLTFVTLALSAFACHVLVLSLTGSRVGAFSAALFYAFNSYILSHLAQLQLVSVQWIALALFALHRLFGRGGVRPALELTIFTIFVALGSFYYLAFFSVALAILTPAYLWSYRVWREPRKLVLLSASGLVSAGIAFALSMPYRALFDRYGFTGEPASLDLRAFFEPPNRNLLFGDLGPFRLTSYFVGYVALGLALWGAVSVARGIPLVRRDTPRLVWAAYGCLAVLSFLFAAGPKLWIGGHPFGAGPFELLQILGPFGKLREPARMAVLVYLGLAMFLALGVARLFRGWSSRKQIVGAALLGALLLAEQWSPRRTQGVSIPVGDELPPVYSWLRDYPEAGAVAELPVRPFHQLRRTSMEAYFSTFHERPILFSKPSFYPPAMELLQWELRDFPDHRSLTLLRVLDVRFALVHPKRWGANRRLGLRRLDRLDDALTLLRQFDDRSEPLWADYQLGAERLYAIAPEEEGPGPPRECACVEIDRRTFRLEANGVTSPELAVDGDRLTKWTTGEAQGKGFFFEITFDRPRRPVRVEIEMAFPYGEFARNLAVNGYVGLRAHRIEQIEDVSYQVELVRQLIADPTKARLRYDLEPLTVDRLRLFIQRTEEGTIGWSIPEIHVYESEPPE